MLCIADPFTYTISYLNSVMNPIICYIVCKSVRDDIKHFIRDIARRIRRCCTCGRSQREIPTPNVTPGTPAIYNIELTSRNAGKRCSPNVETGVCLALEGVHKPCFGKDEGERRLK